MIYNSHPEKKLKQHLSEVTGTAVQHALKYVELVEVTALLHDFGKYTSFFQNYLAKKARQSNLSNHGFVSAICTAFVMERIIGDDTDKDKAIYPLLAYSVVLSHHGDLKPFYDDKDLFNHNLPSHRRYLDEDKDIRIIANRRNMLEQLADMRKNKAAILAEYENTLVRDSLSAVFDLDGDKIEALLLRLRKLYNRYVSSGADSRLYFMHHYVYSLLIWADKNSAANIHLPVIKTADYAAVNAAKEAMIKEKGASNDPLAAMRRDIFDQVRESVAEHYAKSVFSITSPTGSGKTFTGFFAALQLREASQLSGKIIYALPFTSIINQNFDIIRDMYTKGGYEGNDYVLMHHHLAAMNYQTKDAANEEYQDYRASQFQEIFEGWQSGVIVTTFVQLMETLISVRNRPLKKFNTLAGSIILIDEVQAMDIEYYKLLEQMIRDAVEHLDCKFIIMTATKPLICPEAQELLREHETYFAMVNRTKIAYEKSPVTVKQFAEIWMERFQPDKSYMIVCNTVQSSIDLYQELSDKNLGVPIYYLSANIVSGKKESVIDCIDKLQMKKARKPHVLVSTQVVEAGVDFSFDVVYRDLAPLSNIIQTAGRCNRHGADTMGEVFVIKLMMTDGENNPVKPCANLIYGDNLLRFTEEILEQAPYLSEENYFLAVNAYYAKVKENCKSVDSDAILGAINILDFAHEKLRYFSLIKNQFTVEVFCLLNDEAQVLFEQYLAAFAITDKNDRRDEFIRLKPLIAQYTVSVPANPENREKLGKKTLGEITIYYIDQAACGENYNGLYHIITGFVRKTQMDLFA